MDPQIRVLLELAYECIIDGGFNPEELRGKRVGVFIAVAGSDPWRMCLNEEDATGYELMGCAISMLANRISFAYDFKGPSFVVDAACSSSLMAFKLGVSAIQVF